MQGNVSAFTGLVIAGLGMKLCRATKPATTGAKAAGICGSLALAICCLPFTTYLWISV